MSVTSVSPKLSPMMIALKAAKSAVFMVFHSAIVTVLVVKPRVAASSISRPVSPLTKRRSSAKLEPTRAVRARREENALMMRVGTKLKNRRNEAGTSGGFYLSLTSDFVVCNERGCTRERRDSNTIRVRMINLCMLPKTLKLQRGLRHTKKKTR
jgi:hypothetical protein